MPTLNINIPDADASNRGTVSTGTQTMAGDKTWTGTHTNTGLITGNGGLASVSTSTLAAVDAQGVTDGDYVVYTTTQTLDETHHYIAIGTLAGDITINLPACNATRDGWEYYFTKLGTDAFAFILDPNSTETFYDSATTKSIYSQGNSAYCKCRSSDSTWFYKER